MTIKGTIRQYVNALKAVRSGSLETIIGDFKRESSSSVTTLNSTKDYLSSFEQINYIAKCTNKIAQYVASMEYKTVSKDGKTAEDSKVFDIFAKPAEGWTYYSWTQAQLQHYLLDGNVFLYRYKRTLGSFTGGRSDYVILNPALVRCMVGEKEIKATANTSAMTVDYYKISGDSVALDIPSKIMPADMIHVKLQSPHNNIRGMGIVQQNSTALLADSYTNVFNDMFFRQGIRGSLIVSPKTNIMTPQDWKEWQMLFRKNYEGAKNWGKAIFTPPNVDMSTMSSDHNDVQYIEQRKLTRQDVAEIFFDLPPLLAGIADDSKYDNAEEQLFSWVMFSLPNWTKPFEISNTEITNDVNKNLLWRYVLPQAINKDKMTTVAGGAFDRGVISGRKYLEMIGEVPDESDKTLDQKFIKMIYLPIEQATLPQEQPEKPEKDDSKSVYGYSEHEYCGIELKQYSEFRRSNHATEKQLRFHRLARRTKKTRIEPLIMKDLKRYVKELTKRVIVGLEKDFNGYTKKDLNLGDMFNEAIEEKESLKNSKNFFRASLSIAIDDLNTVFDSKVDKTSQNPVVQLTVDKLSTNYVDHTLKTRKKEIQSIIQRSIDEGLSLGEIKNLIAEQSEAFTGENAWKAMRIARTEASNAYDQAALMSYKSLGRKFVDVVGCSEIEPEWNCNIKDVPIDEYASITHHINHTGTAVPSERG